MAECHKPEQLKNSISKLNRLLVPLLQRHTMARYPATFAILTLLRCRNLGNFLLGDFRELFVIFLQPHPNEPTTPVLSARGARRVALG